MALLVDVGTHLATAGHGTVDVSIFEGQMPDDVNEGLSLHEYAAEEPEYSLGVSGVHYEQPRFQLYCRHTDYVTGRALIEAAYQTLAKVVNTTLTATKYLRIEPLSSPSQLEPARDAMGRWEWRANFRAEKALG